MGFLDELKKNLGFDKAEQETAERASEGPQDVREPSAGETLQSAGLEASADAGAVAGSNASVEPTRADTRSVENAALEPRTAVPDDAAAADKAAAAARAGTVTEVVVETDDTLSGIAVQFSVDLDALIAVNADTVPNPDHIYPGQVLRLP